MWCRVTKRSWMRERSPVRAMRVAGMAIPTVATAVVARMAGAVTAQVPCPQRSHRQQASAT